MEKSWNFVGQLQWEPWGGLDDVWVWVRGAAVGVWGSVETLGSKGGRGVGGIIGIAMFGVGCGRGQWETKAVFGVGEMIEVWAGPWGVGGVKSCRKQEPPCQNVCDTGFQHCNIHLHSYRAPARLCVRVCVRIQGIHLAMLALMFSLSFSVTPGVPRCCALHVGRARRSHRRILRPRRRIGSRDRDARVQPELGLL